MKKIILIGLSVLLGSAALVSLSFFQESEPGSTAKSGKTEKQSCCSGEEGTGEFSENSIFQLTSEWTSQDGRKVKLSDFGGKQIVLTMFFASCTYACPILVQDMKRIESEIPEDKLGDYRFVLLSIDPERDTPEQLKKFAGMKALDTDRWTLLTGSEDAVMEFAAVTGLKYKKEDDGQFSHSNIINIIDSRGEILYQHTGLNQDVALAANYLKNNKE